MQECSGEHHSDVTLAQCLGAISGQPHKHAPANKLSHSFSICRVNEEKLQFLEDLVLLIAEIHCNFFLLWRVSVPGGSRPLPAAWQTALLVVLFHIYFTPVLITQG